MHTSTGRIAFLGDIHGRMDAFDLMVGAGLYRGYSTFVQVGDFWMYSQQELIKAGRVISRHCENYGIDRKSVQFFFIDGNHENFSVLDPYAPQPVKFSDTITYLPRGHQQELSGTTIGCAGGAVSIDQRWRTQGKDWWPQEHPLPGDFDALNEDVDILVSHEAPLAVREVLLFDFPIDCDPGEGVDASSREVSALISATAQRIHPCLVVHGHHHRFQLSRSSDGYIVMSLGMEKHPGSVALVDLHTSTVTVPLSMADTSGDAVFSFSDIPSLPDTITAAQLTSAFA